MKRQMEVVGGLGVAGLAVYGGLMLANTFGFELPWFHNERTELSEEGIIGAIRAEGRLDLASREYINWREEIRQEQFGGLQERAQAILADGEAHVFVDLEGIDDGSITVEADGDVQITLSQPYIDGIRVTETREAPVDQGFLGGLDDWAGFDDSIDGSELIVNAEESITEVALEDEALINRGKGCATRILTSLLSEAGLEGDAYVTFAGDDRPFVPDPHLVCFPGEEGDVTELPPEDLA